MSIQLNRGEAFISHGESLVKPITFSDPHYP
jgi:hypothetical protein